MIDDFGVYLGKFNTTLGKVSLFVTLVGSLSIKRNESNLSHFIDRNLIESNGLLAELCNKQEASVKNRQYSKKCATCNFLLESFKDRLISIYVSPLVPS